MGRHIILAAINAKYIHSNLAIYSLKANAGEYAPQIVLREYTVNHRKEEILADLYEQRPDILGFSCYLWNIEYVTAIAGDLKKICPDIRMIAGGPEVSSRPEQFLRENECFELVMTGEGERTFARLLRYYKGSPLPEGGGGKEKNRMPDSTGTLSDIPGIVFRDGNAIRRTAEQEAVDMDKLVFPYRELAGLENRILYYESMRGCPFSCSYCLSSIEKSVRVKSLGKTFQELDFFLEAGVPQVKFVDRTFNCHHGHAHAVWEYLKEHDNGVTNFHFEIAGDLFREEDFALLASMRPGLVQFEIGVQSTNPDTLRAVRRTTDLGKLRRNVRKIQKARNIHIHLDLIAGLPFEDYPTFRKSFDDVYAMKPDQLQLGFLKVLAGSAMGEERDGYGVVSATLPPYEVYATRWLSYGDVRDLKQVEEMVEVYYNSFQFTATVAYLERFFPDAFGMYWEMGQYYRRGDLSGRKHSRVSRYEILWEFAAELPGVDPELLRETLAYDLYRREFVKSAPDFVRGKTAAEQEAVRRYLGQAERDGALPPGYQGLSVRQLCHMLYIGFFHLDMDLLVRDGKIVERERYALLFDYRNRSPLDHSAGVSRISGEDFP